MGNMFNQIRISLFFVSMFTTAFESSWDKLVKESLQGNRLEHFALEKLSCSPTCPPGWVTYEHRCFTYIAKSVDWISAEKHCLNLSTNLVSIHNENEYQLVKALIRAHDPNENPTWIGLSDCQKENHWVWSDGTKLSYTNWNPGEPNFLNKECCVHLNWSEHKKWNDIPCEIKYPFICVKRIA